MSDFMGIIVVVVALACTWLAQSRFTAKSNKSQYSLLGGVACILVAVEALHRSQPGVCVLFASAAAVNLLIVVLAYLKPTKPDA